MLGTMTTDTVRTRHRISGVIDENTPIHIAEHPVLGEYLEVVGPDAKPFLPEMHRVSLPADATKDQIKSAEVAVDLGLVDPAVLDALIPDKKDKS
jgi:hypothetical protein